MNKSNNNNDIVIRLRMSADLVGTFPKAIAKSIFPASWLTEAADEIERLRINRDRWRKTAEQLARELGKVEYAQATYEDVVRDGKYDALMSTTDWEDYE